MKRVEIKGYIIFDETELSHGDIVAEIDHELFNVEGVMEWDLQEVSNEEIEYKRDEDE